MVMVSYILEFSDNLSHRQQLGLIQDLYDNGDLRLMVLRDSITRYYCYVDKPIGTEQLIELRRKYGLVRHTPSEDDLGLFELLRKIRSGEIEGI